MIDVLPFATYSFVMSITPGPNNVMLTASGARFGFRRTLPHMLGIAFGHATQVVAASLGLGALFVRWPVLQTILQWTGAAYLLVLGWKLLRAPPAGRTDAGKPISFQEGALFQYVNPKAWVMSLTTASVFLPPALPLPLTCVYLVAMMAVVNVPCISLWAMFGSALRGHLQIRARRFAFNGAMALGLAGTSVAMLL